MADREYLRKLVDEVLGADRNKLPDQFGEFGVKFTDDRVGYITHDPLHINRLSRFASTF